MRGRHDEIKATGAELYAIGMGIPEMAADFRESQDVPFPLLVDRTKETYRALDFAKAEWWDVAGPPVWIRFARGLLSGHVSAWPKQDPKQLAGVAVVDAGGNIRYLHRAKRASDNPPIDRLLKELR